MREIKFRAWFKKEKRWLHGYPELGGCNIVGETILLCEWCSGIRLEDLNDVEVSQYTGLKDKNNRELFEGDIIGIKDIGEDSSFVSKVFFEEGEFRYIDKDTFSYPLSAISSEIGKNHKGSHFCKIIGNIYENPELLNN